MKMLIRSAQVLVTALAIFGIGAVLHPDLRMSIRTAVRNDYRTVLSTARSNLNGQGSLFTVAKIKTRDNIYLEIFETLADSAINTAPRLVERIEIADARDAFFNFNGQATNLAIDDVDGDGRPEILAPTFDRNLVGRLNIFQYDNDTQGFTRK